jgi:hypothetical protein
VLRTWIFAENLTRNSCSVAAVDSDLILQSELVLKSFLKGSCPTADDISLENLLFRVA